MELKMITGSKKVTASDQVFAYDFNEGLVHQAVTAYLAGARQGTKAQKTRSDVQGGGAKPWRQKGTGRARAGTSRSPIWRSGGVTFAARPRDFSQKINKKMYKRALASILSELVRKDRLHVIDKFEVAEPKTKLLAEQLKKLKLDNVLIVLPAADDKVALAARNIPHVEVCEVTKINPVNLISHENVLIVADAIKTIEEKIA